MAKKEVDIRIRDLSSRTRRGERLTARPSLFIQYQQNTEQRITNYLVWNHYIYGHHCMVYGVYQWEKANGSIIPSWIIHTISSLFSGICTVFSII